DLHLHGDDSVAMRRSHRDGVDDAAGLRFERLNGCGELGGECQCGRLDFLHGHMFSSIPSSRALSRISVSITAVRSIPLRSARFASRIWSSSVKRKLVGVFSAMLFNLSVALLALWEQGEF